MITGPLTKAAAEDIERALRVLEEDEDEVKTLWDKLSPKTQEELESRSLRVCTDFCLYLGELPEDKITPIFEACLREYCDDMEFTPLEKSIYCLDWGAHMREFYLQMLKTKQAADVQTSIDWYRVTMLEVAEQMRNIKLERIAAVKAKELGIDTDSKAYSELLKIMRIDLDSYVSVTKQSVRDSVHGTLGRTGKAYLEKWKNSQKQ